MAPPPSSAAEPWIIQRIHDQLVREGWTVLDLTAYRTNRGIVFGFGGMVETPAGRHMVAGTYHQLTGRVTIERLERLPEP